MEKWTQGNLLAVYQSQPSDTVIFPFCKAGFGLGLYVGAFHNTSFVFPFALLGNNI